MKLSQFPCCKKDTPSKAENEVENEYETNENNDKIELDRKVYNLKNFSKEHPSDEYVGFDMKEMAKKMYNKNFKPGKNCFKKNIENRIPVIKLIRTYRIKEYLISDIFAGLTVGITHIPQGLAYAIVTTVSPVYGLYTSFFPVLMYFIFGTSYHISVGTFAQVSLIVAATLTELDSKYVPPSGFNKTLYDYNLAHNIKNEVDASEYLSFDRDKARLMIVTANAFWVGLIQLGMALFQLTFLTAFLSEPLVNGFVSGAAVHVITSQLKPLFGFKLKSYNGILKVPNTWIDAFSKIPKINPATLITSIICCIVLILIKYVNKRFGKKWPVQIPAELIIVVFGTLISSLTKLDKTFNIEVLGTIPAGFPTPEFPPLFIIKDMIVKTFLMAIITFSSNISLADIFAKEKKYKINPTQELIAYGISNIFSSFFSCFTNGASLARSTVQHDAGGRSQMVSFFSCVLVGIVLLFIAPLFESLPQSCLGAIIGIALISMFRKLSRLPFYWRLNKIEFLQFFITFNAVWILDIDIGLGVGVGFYILAHMIKTIQPYSTTLGNIVGTELYKDLRLYKDAKEIDKIKIVRIQSELHATNANTFKKAVYELTNVKPQYYMAIQNKISNYKKKMSIANNPPRYAKFLPKVIRHFWYGNPDDFKIESKVFNITNNNDVNLPAIKDSNDKSQNVSDIEIPNNKTLNEPESISIEIGENQSKVHNYSSSDSDSENDEEKYLKDKFKMPELPIKYLIIDGSPINFVDTVGVKVIKQLIQDYNQIGVTVFLADCNDAVIHKFKLMAKEIKKKNQGKSSTYIEKKLLKMTIHDAVNSSLNSMANAHNVRL